MMKSHPGVLVSSPIAIEDHWIDYNSHLNMAYYTVIFDRALDETLLPIGLGPGYIKATGCTYVAVEAHICYLREVLRSAEVRVGVRLLDLDAKRAQFYCEMRHATEDWLAATSEWMFLHVDTARGRAAPWPAPLSESLGALKAAGSSLPWPERASRRIAIPRKA